VYIKVLIKKIIKRLHYVFYINRKKQIFRYLTYLSTSRYPKFLRLNSYPYTSGDTFRWYSDHLFDETSSFDPNKVRKKDLVFVKTDLVENFFLNYHKDITNQYYLITHNSDRNVNEELILFKDEKIIKWFAQNLEIPMIDGIYPIPIGLENRRYLNNGMISDFDVDTSKTNLIISSFNLSTNKAARSIVHDLSKKNNLIENLTFSNHIDYIKSLSTFKFNLCPSGNGLDTHRIWESLMVETIPVMLSNNFSNNFYNLGIPILLIEKWEELNKLNKTDLDELYNKIINNGSLKQFVNFEYWKKYLRS